MINPRNPDYANTPASSRRPKFDYLSADSSAPPLVSIVTPFHNPGRAFEETVASVQAQSLARWEWILVDDCSTDSESLELLRALAEREPRVRVVRQKANAGPAAARNEGVRQARAEYVFFLDADDLIEPTCLEKTAWGLSVNPQFAFIKGYSVGFGASEYLWTNGFHSGPEVLRSNLLTITALVRKSVFEKIGGFDEGLKNGLEDWDFWVRAASAGHWGNTIPEYLDWYRRRSNHSDRWSDWDGAEREAAIQRRFAERHPKLFETGGFPLGQRRWPEPFDEATRQPPFQNSLQKKKQRLLMLVPWLQMGGADKFNVRLIQQLQQRGWEVSVATSVPAAHNWMYEFTDLTPDVFVLDHFLNLRDYPAFLRYLIESRGIDVVMITNSELGYLLLPYLRAVCPNTTFVDYCHMEEDYWKNGGYPRHAVGMQSQLDLNIVSSNYLKGWMTRRGGDPAQIEVCYTNESVTEWSPDPVVRKSERTKLGVSEDTAVLLFAGRICKQKQPHVFAKTMRELARTNPNFLALVAGDGEDRPWLEQFVREHQLERNVKLLGAVPNAAMRPLMAASDIYFLPSLWEGIALSIFEAMAMGLAIVGADVGGQIELVDPDSGYLLARGSEDQEVERYTKVLAKLVEDRALRERMGTAGRARIAAHFALEHMGTRMADLLASAIAKRRVSKLQQLTPRLAEEFADRTIEYVRLQQVADAIWLNSQRANSIPVNPNDVARELMDIQASRAWQMVSFLKQTLPYRVLARFRWGEEWAVDDPFEAPASKLARIKNSRSWRAINVVKATSPYRWYSSRKERDPERS